MPRESLSSGAPVRDHAAKGAHQRWEGTAIRGDDRKQGQMWSYLPEARVPKDHLPRPIREMTDTAPAELTEANVTAEREAALAPAPGRAAQRHARRGQGL